MKILALDLSTSTGWALFDERAQPVAFGTVVSEIQWDSKPYPRNFVEIADKMAEDVIKLVTPEVTDIVIEEINKTGRFGSRHSQKLLDSIHHTVCKKLLDLPVNIHYINTSTWRKHLKLSVADTKKLAKPFVKQYEDLKSQFNKETDKVKKKQLKSQLDAQKEILKQKCIHGKIDKKSISVAYANLTWGFSFNKGQNDITDALAQGYSFMTGAPTLTNKDIFSKG